MYLFLRLLILIITTSSLTACLVGPNYQRPPVVASPQFKETAGEWKIATPCDNCNRGEWWKVFNDSYLDQLESQLNICNQNIATAVHQYLQALAIVDEARASFFPAITASGTLIRQNQGATAFSNSNTSNGGSGTSTIAGSSHISTYHSLLLSATWEPDLWGAVRRNVEANIAAAQASAAQLALIRLSSQASLAQYYFELRALDADQVLLDKAVVDYQKTLKYVMNRRGSGVASLADVVQARTQLETAQAAAINNGITRAQYEHAIAVLIGVPPAIFAIPCRPLTAHPPEIPVLLPCALLERRPDVASSERLMKQANAQIGVAVAAYFPNLTLSATGNSSSSIGLGQWFSNPAWALGSQLMETVFDGGLRAATLKAAKSSYWATVATYRQTVLSAFQDVEDNLVALRLLRCQSLVLDQAAKDARLALKLVMNQYKAGTVDYSAVLLAQTTAYTAEKNAADVNGLRMTATVGLIRALGGGWSDRVFCGNCKPVLTPN